MKVGDRAKSVYHEFSGMATVIRIGDWDDDFNPYKIMVRIDGKPAGMGCDNFKEAHLVVIKPLLQDKGG